MKIVKYGQNILREKTQDIQDFDEELIQTADEMYLLMMEEKGVGIAANQVGISKNFTVIDIQDGSGRIHLVNPVIVSYSEELESDVEGCLSVPGVFSNVNRSKRVVVQAYDLKGNSLRFEAEELFARVIQHEVDHLNGLLFIDRVDRKDRVQMKGDLRRLKKKYKKQNVY